MSFCITEGSESRQMVRIGLKSGDGGLRCGIPDHNGVSGHFVLDRSGRVRSWSGELGELCAVLGSARRRVRRRAACRGEQARDDERHQGDEVPHELRELFVMTATCSGDRTYV